MTKITDIPAIRFKGFSDTWEQRKVREVTDRYDNLRIPVAASLRVAGTTPYYGANGIQDYVDGYTHDGEFILVAEDGANDLKNYPVKCVKGRIWVNNHAHVLQGKYDCADNQFLAYAISQADIESLLVGGGRAKLNAETLMGIDLLLPNKAEQIRIGKYLAQLDNLITLHQRKYDKLTNVKKSMLEKMFPQNGSNAPEIRFKGFTEAWEQRKFSDLVQIERGGSPRPIDDFITDSPDGLNWVKIGDAPAQGNYITKTAEKIKPEGLSKTREVHPGDLILSNSMSFGKPYIMGIDGCIHDGWLLIRNTYKAFDLTFLCHLLGTPQMIIQYKSLAAGSTVNNLNKELVGNTVVTIPTIKEQRVLGQYLETLDLITLHQREFAFLCKEKSKKFRYIKNAWEQRKFGEVFDCTVPNNTLSRAELSYDEGTVLNVHYGDVLIKYGSVLDVQKDDIPRIPHRCREDFNGALLQDGDVIIADTAEDETTGKACEIGNLQGSAIVSGLHTMVCRPRNRMALGYLGYYLNSNAYHYQLLPLMQGIKVLSLSRSNIQKTSVSYPSAMKEQQLIASYFSQLDHLITLHQCE